MRLPRNYFENLSKARYKEYLKLLPDMNQGNNRMFIMISLTLGALIFFGVFAINPTLTTIADLEKQLQEQTQVEQQLRTKIANLSSLQQQYSQLEPRLQSIYTAVPRSAEAPLVTAQINALAEKYNLTIASYRISEVELAKTGLSDKKTKSYVFNLQAAGNYQDMLDFSDAITKIDRIITLESMSVSRDARTNQLQLTLRGRQYFKP